MDRVCFTDLRKRYGGVDALRGVSLRIGEGELFGIIGPDGAGKTTLLRILASLLVPDGGTAQVCGLDVVHQFREVRRRLGYMPGRFSLYQDLTVEENLRFFARLFGTSVEANYDLIADIYGQLAPFKDRRAGKLSGGMKQKLALCCSLVHRPRCCCSTSLPRGSTRCRAANSGRCWTASRRRASRWWPPRLTWTRRRAAAALR